MTNKSKKNINLIDLIEISWEHDQATDLRYGFCIIHLSKKLAI